MSPDKLKATAVAKLKNGEDLENISEDLEISSSIVREWAEELELSPNGMIAKEVNSIAIQKAQELLEAEQMTDDRQLQATLLNLAISIANEVAVGLFDHEIAKALNVSADTISKLQAAFFAKGTQIAFVNDNSNVSSENLKVFKGLLRK